MYSLYHGDTLPYPPPLTIWQASTLYFSNNYLLPLIPDFNGEEEEERKGRKKDQGRPEGAQKKRRLAQWAKGGFNFKLFWNFSRNQIENDRYWQKNLFFANYRVDIGVEMK
jgi:hypothetical protein